MTLVTTGVGMVEQELSDTPCVGVVEQDLMISDTTGVGMVEQDLSDTSDYRCGGGGTGP